MSQSGAYIIGTSNREVETLTGNTGGPVAADGSYNINIVGSGAVTVTGTPGTNTLTITDGGAASTQFDTDSGSAVPVANVLDVLGGSNINTAGATNNVTVNLDNTVTISGAFTTTGGNVNIGTTTPGNPYDLSLERTVAGLIGSSMQNLSTSTSAGVNMQMLVEVGAGDPFVLYSVNGGGTWAGGIDNSDSDLFKFTTGSSPSAGTEVLVLNSTGDVSLPQYGTGIVASDTNGVLSSITGTDGQLIIGATGADPIFASLTSTGGTITITPGANSLNIETAGGGGGVDSLAGNSGGALTGALDVVTANSTVTFAGSGTTITQDFNLTNLVLGSSLPSLTTGTGNVGLGSGVLAALTEGTNSVAIGNNALDVSTTGANKIAIGKDAMGSATTGCVNSIAIGEGALDGVTTSGDGCIAIGLNALGAVSGTMIGCTAIGFGAMDAVTTGINCTAIGSNAIGSATGSNSSVAIGHNSMFSATSGSINSVAIGGSSLTKTTESDCIAVGFEALKESTSSGPKLAIGSKALSSVTTGGTRSIAIGYHAMRSTSGGIDCVALGYLAIGGAYTGNFSVAIGSNVMDSASSASNCVALGHNALGAITTGNNNTALGAGSLDIITTGSENISIGKDSGNVLATSDSHNICINNSGTAGDNNTLRIGAGTGTGTQQLNSAFIHGIEGVNVGSVAKVATINSDQLGSATITGGTNITVTPTANTITIDADPDQELTYISTTAATYTVLSTDQFVSVDASGGAKQVDLPNTTDTGRVIYVKDQGGDAATNNITVTTPGGTVTIDGATTFVMNTNYQSAGFIWSGSTYEIF